MITSTETVKIASLAPKKTVLGALNDRNRCTPPHVLELEAQRSDLTDSLPAKNESPKPVFLTLVPSFIISIETAKVLAACVLHCFNKNYFCFNFDKFHTMRYLSDRPMNKCVASHDWTMVFKGPIKRCNTLQVRYYQNNPRTLA